MHPPPPSKKERLFFIRLYRVGARHFKKCNCTQGVVRAKRIQKAGSVKVARFALFYCIDQLRKPRWTVFPYGKNLSVSIFCD